jgi:hypothetical protein
MGGSLSLWFAAIPSNVVLWMKNNRCDEIIADWRNLRVMGGL